MYPLEINPNWMAQSILVSFSNSEIPAQNSDLLHSKLKATTGVLQCSYKIPKALQAPESKQRYKNAKYNVDESILFIK